MSPQYWIAHTGRNPAHRFGKGRDRWKQKFPKLDGTTTELTFLGPKNPSRWLPHQGKQECARRLRQMEARA